jgi:3-hydroxyacyl-CoA dehydrogenase
MTDLVQLTKDKNIAIITINNPPVNALSPGVPEGISEALDQIVQDVSIKAAALIGGGRTFVAGADIKEFGKMTSGKSHSAGLLPLLLKIEDSSKPVIVAIHGTAFGGGLELAMAGHYRACCRCAGWPAGSETRTHPRRGRDAATAAARWCREGCRDVCRWEPD